MTQHPAEAVCLHQSRTNTKPSPIHGSLWPRLACCCRQCCKVVVALDRPAQRIQLVSLGCVSGVRFRGGLGMAHYTTELAKKQNNRAVFCCIVAMSPLLKVQGLKPPSVHLQYSPCRVAGTAVPAYRSCCPSCQSRWMSATCTSLKRAV